MSKPVVNPIRVDIPGLLDILITTIKRAVQNIASIVTCAILTPNMGDTKKNLLSKAMAKMRAEDIEISEIVRVSIL